VLSVAQRSWSSSSSSAASPAVCALLPRASAGSSIDEQATLRGRRALAEPVGPLDEGELAREDGVELDEAADLPRSQPPQAHVVRHHPRARASP
jgi:hypothetical protein